MNYLILFVLALVVVSLLVGLIALLLGKSQLLKNALTVRIGLSLTIFVLFLLYYLLHSTSGGNPSP